MSAIATLGAVHAYYVWGHQHVRRAFGLTRRSVKAEPPDAIAPLVAESASDEPTTPSADEKADGHYSSTGPSRGISGAIPRR